MKFSEYEGQITLSDITFCEHFVGLKFPNEYVTHLFKFDGGRCVHSEFTFIENGVERSRVNWFLAVGDQEFDNFKDYIIDFKLSQKMISSSFLPIANDPFGNLICTACKDGKIYFWNHEGENDNPDQNRSNVHYLAETLPDFLNSLHDED